jgi:hypothetical protein
VMFRKSCRRNCEDQQAAGDPFGVHIHGEREDELISAIK